MKSHLLFTLIKSEYIHSNSFQYIITGYYYKPNPKVASKYICGSEYECAI